MHHSTTPTTIAVFDKLAQLYQEKFMDVSLYAAALDVFCKHLPAGTAAVLDVACGPGNVASYLLQRRPELNLLGTDLAPAMLQLAKANNPGAAFQLLDARELHRLQQRFDGLVCSFCLPYLTPSEAEVFFKSAAQRLQPHGVLYLSTMEDPPGKSGFETGSSGDTLFMNYHQVDQLMASLRDAGFTLLYEERKTYTHNEKATTDWLAVAVLQPA